MIRSTITTDHNLLDTSGRSSGKDHQQEGAGSTFGSLPRRGLEMIGSLLVVLALALGVAGSASASTSSSIGVAGATSYGYYCNSSYNWVHQNWPNIWVNTSTNQTVYVRSLLYRWNGSDWVNVRISQWYVGVSNNTGRKPLGSSAGGGSYYFALAGQPSVAANPDGYTFLNLADGYYTTREQYQAAGYQWMAWNNVQGSTATYCVV
jgi:hypothetical protein